MASLRDLLAQLGFADPRTLLQSGNIVFGCARRRPGDLESLLEAELEKQLNVATDVFVRSADEWREVVAGNPFVQEAERDPGHLLMMAFKERPTVQAVSDLQAALTGPEVLHPGGRHAYIVYPNGTGTSRLTNAVIEKKLRTRVTGRNWNTVLKLHTLIAS
jgi:uncharacterized protein (DUF1697 family)